MIHIKKKIRTDPSFNPFNDKFEIGKVESQIQIITNQSMSAGANENVLNRLSYLVCLPLLNSYYKGYYNFLHKFLNQTSLNISQIIEYLVACTNRNYILSHNILNKDISKGYYLSHGAQKKIKSIDESIGEINLIGALEAQYDNLNLIFNYLRYVNKEFKPQSAKRNETDEINSLLNLSLYSNLFNVVKVEFDEIVWNDGNIQINEKDIIFRADELELKSRNIGFHRMARIINQNFLYIHSEYSQQSKDFIKFFKTRNPLKNNKRIKRVLINNGELTYELAKGFDKEEMAHEILTFSEVIGFYEFIENAKFPNSTLIKLKDCLLLFNLIQSLFKLSLVSVNKDDSIRELNDFNKFPNKIKITTLRKYLLERTEYNGSQIKYFLELISHVIKDRFSIWSTPLLISEGFYIVGLLPLISPVSTYLIDQLLLKAGFDLNSRGKLFENYIRMKLKEHLDKSKFNYLIPNKSKYSNKINEFEEIDLIIELKEIIIIAEVKCITYPLDARDFHNSKKTLIDASNQVIRKKNFLNQNRLEFISIIPGIDIKEIIPLVITQYPFYSGLSFNKIPIVDFPVIESYFNKGEYSRHKVKSKSGILDSLETYSTTKYYTDEESFNKNFQDYIKMPYPVKIVLDNCVTKFDKISAGQQDKNIYTTNIEIVGDIG